MHFGELKTIICLLTLAISVISVIITIIFAPIFEMILNKLTGKKSWPKFKEWLGVIRSGNYMQAISISLKFLMTLLLMMIISIAFGITAFFSSVYLTGTIVNQIIPSHLGTLICILKVTDWVLLLISVGLIVILLGLTNMKNLSKKRVKRIGKTLIILLIVVSIFIYVWNIKNEANIIFHSGKPMVYFWWLLQGSLALGVPSAMLGAVISLIIPVFVKFKRLEVFSKEEQKCWIKGLSCLVMVIFFAYACLINGYLKGDWWHELMNFIKELLHQIVTMM